MMKCSTCCPACAAECRFALLPTALLPTALLPTISIHQIPRVSVPHASVCCPLQHHSPLAATFSTTCNLHHLYSVFTAHSTASPVLLFGLVAGGSLIPLCKGLAFTLHVLLLSWSLLLMKVAREGAPEPRRCTVTKPRDEPRTRLHGHALHLHLRITRSQASIRGGLQALLPMQASVHSLLCS